MRADRFRPAPFLLALVAAIALAGCGVSASGAPEDIGEPARVGGAVNNDARKPDGPNTAGSERDKLVLLYLQAAAGGDNQAPVRQREFLTGNALKAWRKPADAQTQPLTVIRIVSPPKKLADRDERSPVEVQYQVVGSLNDQGQVIDPPPGDSAMVRIMTFFVKSVNNTSLRIDDVEGDKPSGLLLSDDALTKYYRPQPIYFWDTTNTRLVPDVRYLPLTIAPDQRAQKLVQWLLEGPSAWLVGGSFTKPLPPGVTTKEGVTNQEGAWYINFSAPNGADGPEGIQRLYHQLQWTLRGVSTGTPSIKLSIDSKPQAIPGAPDDYLRLNLAYELDRVAQSDYDIVTGKVVALPGDGPQPPLLSAKDNANVAYAAVNRSGDAMALVRTGTGSDRKMTVQLIRNPDGTRTDVNIPRSADIGRPAWIPGTQLVLVPSGNQLYVVQPNGLASAIMNRAAPIKSVSVAPDGRRVAWVEGGSAYVAALLPDASGTSAGVAYGSLRGVLARQFTAKAIAWSNEAWVYVVGASGNSGQMWRTTVDSAVAQNVSGGLQGVMPSDVVAFPTGAPQDPGEVMLFTNLGLYKYLSQISQEPAIKNPFFVG